MKNIRIVCTVLLGLIVAAGAISCGQGDLQEKYDILEQQLADANAQLAAQQGKLLEAQTLEMQYEELSTQYEELKEQNDDNLDELESLEAQLEEIGDEIDTLTGENEAKDSQIADLVAQYDELKAQYDILVGLDSEITEENIEQALFDLINQERKSHGLNELVTGTNLVNWSQTNSQDMSVSKREEYYDIQQVPFQRVYIAAGYSSLDRVLNAAMTIWKSHALSYEENILNEDAVYGAVGVVELGDIYYITFMASNYP
jgi:uncharacterized protein YkwD